MLQKPKIFKKTKSAKISKKIKISGVSRAAKIKVGFAVFAVFCATIFANSANFARAATNCAATNEDELYAALADATCGGIITLNKSEIQDKGIQLSRDFDGGGATLQIGTSSYGLLLDHYGLDGCAGVPAGAEITVKNVKIVANSATKSLININDVSTNLENITTDRANSSNYFAHISVKDAENLTLANFTAVGGNVALDYSPATANNLQLSVDEISANSLAQLPAAISATGDGKILAQNAETLAFLQNPATKIYQNSAELTDEKKFDLISRAPFVAGGGNLADGREVVVLAGGADDSAVAQIAENDESFANFLDKVGDDAVFLVLSDGGDCENCAVSATVANLTIGAKYYLYHFAKTGEIEFVGEFSANADGEIALNLDEFSGYVLAKNQIALLNNSGNSATNSSANSANSAKILPPSTGFFGNQKTAPIFAVLLIISGISGAIFAGLKLKKLSRGKFYRKMK